MVLQRPERRANRGNLRLADHDGLYCAYHSRRSAVAARLDVMVEKHCGLLPCICRLMADFVAKVVDGGCEQ
jgi:hypothetical protein